EGVGEVDLDGERPARSAFGRGDGAVMPARSQPPTVVGSVMLDAAFDDVTLTFAPGSLVALNVALARVMIGVALDLRPAAFTQVVRAPRAAIVGLVGQMVLLPALTFALVVALRPPPSVALGMMLVAACPGGNMSNFITHLGRGNTELSVTLTAVGTV